MPSSLTCSPEAAAGASVLGRGSVVGETDDPAVDGCDMRAFDLSQAPGAPPAAAILATDWVPVHTAVNHP